MSHGLDSHRHSGAFEICFIARGEVSWWVDDDYFELRAGDLFMTWPDEVHGGVDGVLHSAELYWLVFALPESGSWLGFKPKETKELYRRFHNIEHRVCRQATKIEKAFVSLLDAHRKMPGSLKFRPQMELLLLSALEAYAGEAKRGRRENDPKISQAINWFKEHLGETNGVEKAASFVGWQPCYFRERFLKATGFTPLNYVNRLRIREARRLLIETEYTITDIAFILNYSSSQYFATAFRKATGMPPLAYRKLKKHSNA